MPVRSLPPVQVMDKVAQSLLGGTEWDQGHILTGHRRADRKGRQVFTYKQDDNLIIWGLGVIWRR